MKWDLTKPCKNCPFRNDENRIKFACRERAEEIEEIAYRQGFVCHRTGEETDTPDGESTMIDFPADGSGQHCAGAALMYLKQGLYNVPMEHLEGTDPKTLERFQNRLNWESLVFESEEEFFKANERGG